MSTQSTKGPFSDAAQETTIAASGYFDGGKVRHIPVSEIGAVHLKENATTKKITAILVTKEGQFNALDNIEQVKDKLFEENSPFKPAKNLANGQTVLINFNNDNLFPTADFEPDETVVLEFDRGQYMPLDENTLEPLTEAQYNQLAASPA